MGDIQEIVDTEIAELIRSGGAIKAGIRVADSNAGEEVAGYIGEFYVKSCGSEGSDGYEIVRLVGELNLPDSDSKSPDSDNAFDGICKQLEVIENPQEALQYFMETSAPGTANKKTAVTFISGFMYYLAQVESRLMGPPELSEHGVNGPLGTKVEHIGLNVLNIDKMLSLHEFVKESCPFQGYKGFTRS